jgi:hypothetical protein
MEKTPRARRIVICVAGMPRSGTSLVTQLLHRCGLDSRTAGAIDVRKHRQHRRFLENLRFVQLNERSRGERRHVVRAAGEALRGAGDHCGSEVDRRAI